MVSWRWFICAYDPDDIKVGYHKISSGLLLVYVDLSSVVVLASGAGDTQIYPFQNVCLKYRKECSEIHSVTGRTTNFKRLGGCNCDRPEFKDVKIIFAVPLFCRCNQILCG